MPTQDCFVCGRPPGMEFFQWKKGVKMFSTAFAAFLFKTHNFDSSPATENPGREVFPHSERLEKRVRAMNAVATATRTQNTQRM